MIRKKYKASQVLTSITNPGDIDYLKSKLLDVNIRLYEAEQDYRELVESSIGLIVYRLNSEYEDYSNPLGMSAANCGIPWNIISFIGEKDEIEVMINPSITRSSGQKTVLSNCGSLRLKEKIPILRYEAITVKYYCPLRNRYVLKTFAGRIASTIQHEIDHNNGILITDRQVRDK